jgi:hypothetical protein
MRIVKNIVAFIVGFISGGAVNMGLIMVSGNIIPPPEGADLTTTEGLNAALPLLEPKHFLFPFLAHSLGTFVGAFVAAKIAESHKLHFAFLIGALTFVGGIVAAYTIPAPTWFIVTDLVLAYFPFAWLASKLAIKK